MSQRNDGGPAFPVPEQQFTGGLDGSYGMTIRDYMAAQAINSLVQHEMTSGPFKHICESACKTIATRAYQIADAMLESRTK